MPHSKVENENDVAALEIDEDSKVITRKIKPPDLALNPSVTILKKGSLNNKGTLPLPCDIIFERDVAVKLRDGTTIYTDIFRPVKDGKYPAIIAWSPYGKENDKPAPEGLQLSGLQKFEGPDPGFWVNQGYVILNPDIRGAGNSSGCLDSWGCNDGRDGYDLVEWVAQQNWSSQKVAFSGNSYLAISQWYIAAEKPPHLTAIAPWEGFFDVYRQSISPGGIPTPAFQDMVLEGLKGSGAAEDTAAMIDKYPLMNAYWRDKIAALDRIEIPAYVVASYTNKVHTRGTIGGFNGIKSAEKWLRIHNTHEWADYYAHQEDLKKFFDFYLQDKKNGWEKTPKVRMAVLDPGGTDTVDRAENEFPLKRTDYQKLFLNASNGRLETKLPDKEAVADYVSDDEKGRLDFETRFTKDTELSGYMKLHLWVEARVSDDMDLFIYIDKLDTNGKSLPIIIKGAPYSGKNGAPYEWGNGWLRVSHRKLDKKKSNEVIPYLSHDELQKLMPSEIVPVEIELGAMGIRFRKGEQLRVTITGYERAAREFPILPRVKTLNRGNHLIHTGQKYDSYLQVPVIS